MILVEEDITEPEGTSKSMKRTVIETFPSDEVGKIIVRTYFYINPPSNKAFGAQSETKDDIVLETDNLTDLITERLAEVNKNIQSFFKTEWYDEYETMQYVGTYIGNYRRL